MGENDDVTLREYLEALNREHQRSHEALAESIVVALASVDRRLEGMNEFRKSLEDFQSRGVSRELFDQTAKGMDARLGILEREHIGRDTFTTALEVRDNQIDLLNNWRSKAVGAGAVLALLAGAVGAAVIKAIGG